MTIEHLDVRRLGKPGQHPALFQAFCALAVDASCVLGHSHDDVQHLLEECETQHPPGYAWQYLVQGPRAWRIRISRLYVHPRRPAPALIPSS